MDIPAMSKYIISFQNLLCLWLSLLATDGIRGKIPSWKHLCSDPVQLGLSQKAKSKNVKKGKR